jgi:hypothetical protein
MKTRRSFFAPLSPAGSHFGTGIAVIAAWNLPSFGVLFRDCRPLPRRGTAHEASLQIA